MKKFQKALSVFGLLFLLLGCEQIRSTPAEGLVTFELPELSSRLLMPTASLDVSSVILTFTGAQVPAPLRITDFGTPQSHRFPTGVYTLTADAFNKDNLQIGFGTATFNVQANQTTQVSVLIGPMPTQGTFKIEAITDGLGLTTPSVSATLSRGGVNTLLPLASNGTLLTASKDLTPGSYILTTQLKSGTTVLSSGVETVFIAGGAQTYAGLSFHRRADGSVLSSLDVTAPKVTNLYEDTTPTALAPVISITPESGIYAGTKVTITITGETGSALRYTLDGTTPTASSPLYSAPIQKTEATAPATVTVRAYAAVPGKLDSPVTAFTYNVTEQSELPAYYSTNPNGQKGKAATITIDGTFTDWTEDMIVVQGVANDDARIFRGAHEGPVYDLYSLSAAWDDTKLYLMWQYTNVTDVADPAQGFPISDNGKPWNGDIPISIAFDVDPAVSASGLIDGTVKSVWGDGEYNTFANGTDRLAMFSAKPGVGQPSLFWPNANGQFDYVPANLKAFLANGISYKWGDGYKGTKPIYGIPATGNGGFVPADLEDATKYKDFKTLGHKLTQDTAYEMVIPFTALGITRAKLESSGIGVMIISTFGQSGIDSLPKDPATLDNATQPYGPDASSSAEKNDKDKYTVPMARVGK